MEVSAGALLTATPGVGPDKMGLRGADGHQHGVRSHGHSRELWRIQSGLHGVRTVPVVVVDSPMAGDIRPAGECNRIMFLALDVIAEIPTISDFD